LLFSIKSGGSTSRNANAKKSFFHPSARYFLPFKPYFLLKRKTYYPKNSPFACFPEKEGANQSVLPYYNYNHISLSLSLSTLAFEGTPFSYHQAYFSPSGLLLKALRYAFHQKITLKQPHSLFRPQNQTSRLRNALFFLIKF
jgi:hypothetical protein